MALKCLLAASTGFIALLKAGTSYGKSGLMVDLQT